MSNCSKKCKSEAIKRHERDSNPRSSVYETDALPLGHRALQINVSGKVENLLGNNILLCHLVTVSLFLDENVIF